MSEKIKNARKVMREAFEEDEDFFRDYVDNVAMVLFDKARGADLKVPQVCNTIAESILKKIFPDLGICLANKEKLYIGTKLIRAISMTEHEFRKIMQSDQVNREGYEVKYPDGYISWSPKEVFEIAYREVTEQEYELF